MKEYQGNKGLHLDPRFWCPARLNSETTRAVQAVALKAAQAVGFRDVARVDIRLSSDGIPFVLEVNPLPGLDPLESNLPMIARSAGLSHETLLQTIVYLAAERTPKLAGRVPTPSWMTGARVLSSIRLSKETVWPGPSPRGGALPRSVEERSGAPGGPAIVFQEVKPRSGRARPE